MDAKEKLTLLEEIMELNEGALAPETSLDAIDEWDSLAALSFVAMMEDDFEKRVSGQDVRAMKTVQDMLDMMVK